MYGGTLDGNQLATTVLNKVEATESGAQINSLIILHACSNSIKTNTVKQYINHLKKAGLSFTVLTSH
jgi:hypothetical protein